jgi:hypothetical protein
MPIDKWDYDGEFLTWFPKAAQSTIANWFCYAVRDGAANVNQVLQQVEYKAMRRLNHPTEAITSDVLGDLIKNIGCPEAEDFAAFIMEREALSPEEKEQLKASNDTGYRNAYMANEEPTAKQLSYLKSLGCKNAPASKLEASRMIDSLVKAKSNGNLH